MPKAQINWKATIRKKLTQKDAHYSGGLVAGAKILELFGDAATALCLRETRGKDEGLFCAYSSVEFLKPVYAGDTVEVTATITQVGYTSRTMKFTAYKTKPKRVLINKAFGTVVLPSLKKS
ncbi:MAG: 3-aminobutyryl-CoA ammonia lyase [Deltaproteobacteria bacterium]|nr:3-aminobutyryl-CoA ammonia lyase [Deltaproteobacteria bacterium]